ncbi:unnamed protein product [Heterobilharzia americana]|nr:unnamed protein product [Heterobilharzia americana]
MDVLVLLLSQICAIKEVPQTIRLLASGTCLTLCSFLHCQSNIISMKSNVSESGGVNKCTYHKHWSSLLVSLMGLLIRSIVRTKTSTQRMRANYYGSLCYVIRFCRNLGQSLKEDKMASSDFKSLSECFSVFTSSSVSGFDTNHSGSVDPSDLNQLHSMLITDLIHGHTVTQMAAMSLLELLVSFDRCSQQLISHLDTQGTIQHILDTVMEDLNTISKFLTSIDTGMLDDSSAAHNNRRSHLPVDPIGSCISTAVSAFLLYQSKMSLLCRIGSYPVGAKILSTHGILNRLANCELFSLSNLASCYSYGLDSLYICEDINQQVNYPNNSDECNQTDLTWFRSSKYLRSFPFSAAVKSDNCVYWDLLELVITGSVECSRLTADEEDEMKVTWAATLIPTLRLCKIVLNSLGPTHMSINQQVFNFVYTHSSSLMCNETQLTSSIVTFLSRQDWSYVNHNPGSSCQINSDWLIQWIASETNIISLFSLIMQACNSSLSISCTDEYSNLQREIIQSKILRHVFELLGNLINPNVSPCDELSRRSQFQSSCLAFEYFFIETQHIQLLCSLLFILTAYLSNPENRIRKFNSDGVNKWSTRSLFQFFSSHTITSEQGITQPLRIASVTRSLFNYSYQSYRRQHSFKVSIIHPYPDLRTVSRDNQNSEILVMQRLTQIGVSCLRVQLCGLIGIIEQSTFLLWKHLTNFINNPDIMLENIKAGTRDQCVQPQRIRDLSFSNNNTTSPFKSPKLSSLTPTKLSAGFTVVGQEDKSLIQKNISLVRSHFEYLMQDDMFEILDQLTQNAEKLMFTKYCINGTLICSDTFPDKVAKYYDIM